MNKKYIGWIVKIIIGISTIISYGISIYEKSAIIFILTTFALLISLIVVLWNKFNKEKNEKETSEKKNKRLENDLQEKENENRALKKEMCQECKKIYTYAHPESLSLSEDFDKCFSLIDEISDKEGTVYYQDEYIFVDFSLGGEREECYLLNLISGLIYLPIDKWKESKGDELLFYRQFCSNRKIHLDFSQLL